MIGRTIAHYEILEKLGEGGMGVVYKARDTHLERPAALKVLPPGKVMDPERKRRFVQEAKAASALNHPNIITIHDIASEGGRDFMVMEYVPGKTLDALIGRKGMPLDEALKCAVQIADALSRAHAAGIVHRDLKPSNIMVDEHGLVKVLDFGLAKLTEPVGPGAETVTAHTAEGAIVGTVAYMSPEQAQGKPVGARSDIFSFGSVLYEMVTGRRAFPGDTNMSTLAAVITREPAPLSAGIPRDLDKLISRCLRKDPSRRFQTMADLKVALEELKEESDSGRLSTAAPVGARHVWPLWLMVPAAVVATLLVAVLVWYSLRPEPAPVLKAIPLTSYPGKEAYASFSPDGNQVAFSWNGPAEDNWDIYVKLIATEAIRRLTSDPAADLDPAWSRDGNHIAFLRTTLDNRVEVVLIPSIGGPQRVIGEIQAPGGAIYRRLTWSPDGKGLVVVHRDSLQEPFALFWLALGGQKRRLTSPPAGWWGDRDPALSPDGRTLLFSRASSNSASELYRLALSPDMTPGRDATRLTFLNRYSISPAWTADGRDVIFASGQSYWTHLWRMRASGSGTPQRLPFAGEGSWQAAVSSSGRRLAYGVAYYDWNIWCASIGEPGRAAGPPRLLISSTRPDRFPKYSPDGKRIAFESTRSGSSEIWVSDSDGSNSLKLTALGAATQLGAPVWSPDGRWIAFSAPIEGREDIFVINAQGGEPRRVTSDPARAVQPQWSPDGHWIYFQSSRTGVAKIWKAPAEGGEAVLTQRMHLGPVSADGRFVFFTKDQGASLWKTPLEGGEETQVLDSFFGSSFAVVKEGIYFIFRQQSGGQSRQSIKFHKFADKTTRPVLDLPKQPGTLDVSPDGRTIVYEQQDQNVWDLMLVENFR